MDSTQLSTRRQTMLIGTLHEAAKARHTSEQAIAKQLLDAKSEADQQLARRRREINEQHRADRQQAEASYASQRAEMTGDYERERTEAQGEYHTVRNQAKSVLSEAARQAEQERKDSAWQTLTIYDATKDRPRERLGKAQAWLANRHGEIKAITNDTLAILKKRGLEQRALLPRTTAPVPLAKLGPFDVDDEACNQARKSLLEQVQQARQIGVELYGQRLPAMLAGPLPAGVFVGLLSAAIPLLGASFGWQSAITYIGSLILGTAGAGGIYLKLAPRSRRGTELAFAQVSEVLHAAKETHDQALQLVKLRAERESAELREQRDAELGELGYRIGQLMSEVESKTTEAIDKAGKHFPSLLATLREEQQQLCSVIDTEHGAHIAKLASSRDTDLAEAEARHATQLEAAGEAQATAWQAMFEAWLTKFDDIRAELRDMRAECSRLFPDFAQTDYQQWSKPTEAAPAIAFGTLALDLAGVPHGLSEDQRLIPPETRLELPALMTLAETPTLLLTASGSGRARGVDLLQAMMLRTLTAMPPGKVRFTILDPVGLGDNFQSFMHLADSDEQLIAGRIWSEPRDLDEQLARLTNHMEVVLQKYLRSEYATIHEYNAMAGEVAEPFQVLVIAGFPANFSEQAARRLVSVVTGGPRCGIYTLMGVDEKLRMPTDFQMSELKDNAVWLDWDPPSEEFVWRHPSFAHLPLTLTTPPPAEAMVDTIRHAGEAAKEAVRVEVPFEVVTPEPGQLWTQTCSEELSVPVGRAGANRLQQVRLGKGTSQHLLVAGKTGSGKSTFLHAFVTSAAMHYSPDEVEFYLVDFKKGVEFKSYATHRLPHARVVAIESEREFGLSVLERLDDELKARGERFRDAGVQNLADYREARPAERVPRLLLIVDEFQELFVQDDRLAQDSALLMDRLVRQGRAFGIHVLLGTQTLAGAYSIARSTLGQMAVRVALECSEADAHLILSDERNTAARFLSRPGEAIYNSQNGLLTANEPFQVVWLPDRERSARLDALDEHRHTLELPLPETIVFEGNAPADPLTNQPLARLLNGEPSDRPAGLPPRAWLGAAVAIKPPTHAELGHNPGANLLVVGSEESSALGILATAIISITAAERARVVVLDGSRPGEEGAGEWQRVTKTLNSGGLVDEASVASPNRTAEVLSQVAQEVVQREAAGGAGEGTAPFYLVLHNAARLRELRHHEDDFSFSSSKETPSRPDQHLVEVLKNGPAVGVHVLVWCDSYNSVTRLFDRQTLREFAQRVALQMSAADSSNLIDSPTASDLAVHRALYYNDESGQTEKFRPYGPPSDAWLARVAAHVPSATGENS